jgi:dienelactone hydrolase
MDQVRHIEDTYKAAGKQIECRVYAGAGHSFLNPDHGAYHGPSATDAWAHAINFFKHNLR